MPGHACFQARGGALRSSSQAGACEARSLGPLTLPHMLVRLLVAEQLYRAAALFAHRPCHRA